MKPKFKITREKQIELIAHIKAYFLKERGEEIGDLGATLLLDFFMEKIAPEFYNQGVADSYKYMTDRAEDLLGLQK